jgi:uncharacterized repeat protein (TIGR03803 family)
MSRSTDTGRPPVSKRLRSHTTACFIAASVVVGPAFALESSAATRAMLPAAARAHQARTQMSVLYSFRGGIDGALPAASLMTDATGALYGTTQAGGTKNAGTVFKLTPSASSYSESVLYSFQGGKHDGRQPVAGLIEDATGALYGTTAGGGVDDSQRSCHGYRVTGCGTVFKLSPSGSGYAESLLYEFRNDSRGDGMWPFAGLIADTAGVLYGTTNFAQYDGNVFKLTPKGTKYKESPLYLFPFSASGPAFPLGALPAAGLLASGSGALYGTASLGGTCTASPLYGCGTVFELTPSVAGYAFTLLYTFQGGNDGRSPFAQLVADKNGNLYGTTQYGGASNNGTVFELTPSGSSYVEHVLYAFAGGNDGALPLAGVVIGKNGALYGTTSAGGAAYAGTVFKLTPAGSGYNESILYAFGGGSDGGDPVDALILDKNGSLYGTTQSGGASGLGSVFAITGPEGR